LERVNIQYSVELEDLEEEVRRITLSAFEDLSTAHASSQKIACPQFLSLEMIDELERIRMSMMRADVRLSDASNIISGYINLKTGRASLPTEDNGPVDEEQINQLKAKIDAFKDSFPNTGVDSDLAD
jgi:hypothetical protein